MKLHLETIDKVKNNLNLAKVLVVGDVMLDRYWFADVTRISPEAPVPIAKINREEIRPGGAANVALNIASLGGDVTLLSVVGADEAATQLERVLTEPAITVKFTQDPAINTTVKLRVLAQHQQLIRIDFEKEPSHEVLELIWSDYQNLIAQFDVVILSDYGKGGLAHTVKMIELANKHNVKVLVDPKGSDYNRYSNAYLITPNKKELQAVIGEWHSEDDLANKAFALKTTLNLFGLLLTRSEEGMTLFANNEATNYSTVTQDVYDVSGAGDTVIATLALMLANGISLPQAISLANIAAGIVVSKLGTATLTKEELLDKIADYGACS